MFKLTALFSILTLARSAAAQSSLYVWNNCGDTIWAHEVYAGYSQVYTIGPQNGAFLSVPPDNNGVAVNFYTGCTDNSATSCTTGGVNSNSGQTPFIRGEVTYVGNTANYDISPLYGYNRALKINTDDANCPGMQCNINSGCPVPGPDGSCYAPCCSSASGCLGTENCPYDPIYNINFGGPGVNSDWYHNACPNAYAFPDDDCSNYGHSPDAGCGDSNRVTMTLCPTGSSSNIDLC
ncbi:Osmotin thaumatin-like protein [Stereum hirsutum FP-91666 SS1]|uniref:Osmotin thaumatin-like protein n=1 Tax=Stereum hirsutum (strain FP-91666) TaxID=721885 RepID=UPI000440A5CD|nr:Osmotin thaumatin-like protein [Stereum hirsutum FP-91666 SS1]EIM86692.1 Osmotin thaumatin-like protein [Stereum hirsutum FP-91666 SS1]